MSEFQADILKFQEATGLSDHRVGWLLAKNGMIVSRLKRGGRVFDDTRIRAERALILEVEKRKLDPTMFHCCKVSPLVEGVRS